MGNWRRLAILLLNLGLLLAVSAQEDDADFFAAGGGQTLEERPAPVGCALAPWTYDRGDGSGPQQIDTPCVDIDGETPPLSPIVETEVRPSDESLTDRSRWCPIVSEYSSEAGVSNQWGFCVSVPIGGGGFQEDDTPSLAPSQEGIRFTDVPSPFAGTGVPSTDQENATSSPVVALNETTTPTTQGTISPSGDVLPTEVPTPNATGTLVPTPGEVTAAPSATANGTTVPTSETTSSPTGEVLPTDVPTLNATGTLVPTAGLTTTAPVVAPNETITPTTLVNETTTSPTSETESTEVPTASDDNVNTTTSSPSVEGGATASPTLGNETFTDVPSVAPENSTEAPVFSVNTTFAPTVLNTENSTNTPTATANLTEGNTTGSPTPFTQSNETSAENATNSPTDVPLIPTGPPTLVDESNAPLGSADLRGFDGRVAGGSLEVVVLPNDTIRVSGTIVGLPIFCNNCFIGLHDGYSCREVTGVDSPGALYSSNQGSTSGEPELVPISTDALGFAEINAYLKGNGREESALTKTVLIYAPQTIKPTYMPSAAPTSVPSSGQSSNGTETTSNETDADPGVVPSVEPTPLLNGTNGDDDNGEEVESGPFAVDGWLNEPAPCAKEWDFYAEGETEPVALSGCVSVSEYEPYLGGNQKAELPSESSGGDPTRWCTTEEEYYVDPPSGVPRITRKYWGYCLDTLPDSEQPGRILQNANRTEVGESSPISCGKVVPLKGPNDSAIEFAEILPVGWPDAEPQVSAELEGDGYITFIPNQVFVWDFSDMVSDDSTSGGTPTPTTIDVNETVVPPPSNSSTEAPVPSGNETEVPQVNSTGPPTSNETASDGGDDIADPTENQTSTESPTTPGDNSTNDTPNSETNETAVDPVETETNTTSDDDSLDSDTNETNVDSEEPETNETDEDGTDADVNPYGSDPNDDVEEPVSGANGTDSDGPGSSPDNQTISDPENQRRSLQFNTGFRLDFLSGGCVNGTIVASRSVADPSGSLTNDAFAELTGLDSADLSVLVTNTANESIQSCADLEEADIPRGSLIAYTESGAETSTVVVSGTGFQPGLIAVGVPCDEGVPFNVSEDGSFMLEYQVPVISGTPEVCITESAFNLETATGTLDSTIVDDTNPPTTFPTLNGTVPTASPTFAPTRNGTTEGLEPENGDTLALALGLGLGLGIPFLLLSAILFKRRSRRSGGAPKADRSYGSPSEGAAKPKSSFGRLRSTLSTKG